MSINGRYPWLPQQEEFRNMQQREKIITVFVDIRDLRIAKTGAKTYLEETCRQLSRGEPGFKFRFVDTVIPVYAGPNKLLKVVEHIRYFGWKQVTLPFICMLRGCDILYCTDYFLPLLNPGFKTAVVFYDAFFWQYPDQYNRLWLFLLNTVGLAAARRADAVITITEYSRRQIHEHTRIALDRIHAIHLAPKSFITELDTASAPVDPSRKFILHIGVLEKRKNLLNLIKAFKMLKEEGFQEYQLVLVGNAVNKTKIDDSANISRLVRELDLENEVIFPGFVTDEELAYYYRNAMMYAFVSVNEGFGLPILEAFQHDLPVLISDNNCLPEVGGDAVVSCNPYDVAAIKAAMKRIISDEALRSSLVTRGRARLAQFSWERTTASLLQVFRALGQKR